MPDRVDPLLQGRASFRSRAWRDAFAELSGLSPDALRRQRHDKYLAIGRNL